jgi:hypothetical protein
MDKKAVVHPYDEENASAAYLDDDAVPLALTEVAHLDDDDDDDKENHVAAAEDT